MPNISVIIPCYNVEDFIERCLESVTKQTMNSDQYEIICVNDCSTDNTWSILEKWERKYPDRMIIVQSMQNGRQGKARNIGLSYARSDWIAFVDADDWIEPDYLAEMFQYTSKGIIDAVCCGYQRDSDKGLSFFQNETEKSVRTVAIDTDEQRKKLILNPVFSYAVYAKLIRKEFITQNHLFFEENLSYEDALWGSLFHLYVKKVVVIDTPLYHYFVNDASTILSKNANNHLDIVTVQILAVQEWTRRGFLQKFAQELEMEYIYSGYLAGLKAAILRFEEPNYHMYLLLKTLMLQSFPSWKQNQYIKNNQMQEVHLLMLESLSFTLSKSEFFEFAEKIKQIGI